MPPPHSSLEYARATSASTNFIAEAPTSPPAATRRPRRRRVARWPYTEMIGPMTADWMTMAPSAYQRRDHP